LTNRQAVGILAALQHREKAVRTVDDATARILIAEHLAVTAEAVTDTARFQHDLGADSLDLIELTMLFESTFGVEIGDEEGECCLTVDDALRLLRRKTSALQSVNRFA
jgi:acyl carrier protein